MLEVNHYIVFLTCGLAFFELAVLPEDAVLHGSLCLVGHLDIVIRQFVILVNINVDLWRQSEVELELEIVAILPLQFLLGLAGDRLAENMQIVVLDELVELLRDNTVDGLVKSLVAIDLLYERRGNHSLAETLEVSVSPVSGESFLLLLGIVLRLQGDGQFDVKIIDLIFCYFHNSVNIILN